MKYSTSALIFAIAGGAFAQLLLKAGLIHAGSGVEELFVSVFELSILSLIFIGFGVGLYGASMIAWIVALKRFELGFAYPLLSLGYLIVYVGAFLWPGMNESASVQKTVGIMLIVFGVALSSQKSNPGLWARHAIPKIL